MDPFPIDVGIIRMASAAATAANSLIELVDGIKNRLNSPETLKPISSDTHAFHSVVFSMQIASQEEELPDVLRTDAAMISWRSPLRIARQCLDR